MVPKRPVPQSNGNGVNASKLEHSSSNWNSVPEHSSGCYATLNKVQVPDALNFGTYIDQQTQALLEICSLRCHACVQAFAQTLQQSRGFGSEFRFPDRPGAAPATTPAGQAAAPAFAPGAAAEDDDDLYS